MSYRLVLLRHGQSAWNKTNQFTGWVDVPLTEKGVAEARHGGELLKEKNVLPDIVFTSLLRRAINTANYALDEADRLWIPVKRSWRLNERHYGALQGKDKSEIREKYGEEKFMIWRRSYGTPPPDIDPDDKFSQTHDPRYAGDPVPEAEALANVVTRVTPYWNSDIVPELKSGKTVMIAAHGNSLRAIVKMLDGLTDEEISKVNIPTGIPLVYELDEDMKPIKPRGEYLDPEAAKAGAAAVAAQGQAKK
ncbi:phosphoglyceromutase [Bifidobacterium sp. ESL0763]|uniref:phosphoglyceromutase n=1 Tax=Bifidobacterium sp. ESL0763 TaxID=2983227 RepID=UPI0023F9C1FB|nr:phosphoglyceromutase [Bifidobacterium sp. ESL0763]MDF7663506.1 phosphoglyceromutase [Bifidobacterium sp. ESL0763]